AELTEIPRPSDFGVVVGFDLPLLSIHRAFVGYQSEGQIGVDAFTILRSIPVTAPAQVAHTFGLRGAQNAISGACASGAVALLQAWHLIQLGSVDAALVGCPSALDDALLAACGSARLLSSSDDPATASRPFDLQRDGFVLGEGAAGRRGVVAAREQAAA